MANICYFKGIVKGNKLNCEKFLEVFPCYDILERKILGDIENSIVIFCGDAPWGICAYAKNEDEVEKLTREQIEQISDEDVQKYSIYRLRDFSKLFDVEIMINSIDEEFCKSNYYHYKNGEIQSDKCSADMAITKKEIKNDELSIKNIKVDDLNKKLINDKVEAINLLKISGSNFKYLCEELRNDAEVVDIALETNELDFQLIGNDLRNDKQFMLKAVKQSGDILKYASDELKDDEEVAFEALTNSGNMNDVSDRLKNDKEFILKVIKEIHEKYPGGERLDELIPDIMNNTNLFEDKDFVVRAASIEGFFTVCNLENALRHDRDVMSAALKSTPTAIIFCDEDLLEDIEYLKSLNLKFTDEDIEWFGDCFDKEESNEYLDIIKKISKD